MSETPFSMAVADARAAIAAFPRRIWLALLQAHAPEDVGEPGTPRPYCLRCRSDWPCDAFTRISDARDKALS